jgi:ribosomal protein S18 acetylase RimI-like enzyme
VSPVPDARQRTLHERLVTATRHDPFVTLDLDPGTLDRVALDDGRAAAYRSYHPWRDVHWVTGIAVDPREQTHVAAAVDLVRQVVASTRADGIDVEGVTVTRGGLELLPDDLRPATYHEWDYWHTTQHPSQGLRLTAYEVQPDVVDVAGDDPRLEALLAVASPSASLRPGDPRVARWAVIEDPEGGLADSGGLAAVVAVTHQRSGAAHLNDVATHPDRRGRRLSRRLCAQVTADALREGCPAVTLGMYADNDAARALYTALGFTCLRGQTSGPVHHL